MTHTGVQQTRTWQLSDLVSTAAKAGKARACFSVTTSPIRSTAPCLPTCRVWRHHCRPSNRLAHLAVRQLLASPTQDLPELPVRCLELEGVRLNVPWQLQVLCLQSGAAAIAVVLVPWCILLWSLFLKKRGSPGGVKSESHLPVVPSLDWCLVNLPGTTGLARRSK